MKLPLKTLFVALLACFCSTGSLMAQENQLKTNRTMEEKLNLTQEWDKVFPQSDEVSHSKVTFHNRYGITLAADLYIPKNATDKLPAIAVCGPFGAVKEQASGLYAQELAKRGFLTMPSIPRSPAKAADNPVMWHRPTSIPRTSARRLTISLPVTM
mgnify:CR=1 FL=1